MFDASGHMKIMIVEDDAAIAGLLATVVESEGFEAVPVYDGETAVELAHEEHPDLITLDLALPKKDGREVLRDLEGDDDTRDIPVIVVSAYTGQLSRDDKQHVAAVVGKPFDIDDLVGKIRQAVDSQKVEKPGPTIGH